MQVTRHKGSLHDADVHREPRIGAVVLNFNGYADTKTCLDSVLRLAYPLKPVICVDNCSTDDSWRLLSSEFPKVKMIRSDKNLGFGGGMNLGLDYALRDGCDYVFCINNDALVDDAELVMKLLEPFQTDPRIGVTGPEEYDISGQQVRFKGPSGRSKHEMKVQGAAFLVSARVLGDVGLYDDAFFLGYEDQDLFLRMQKKGYRLVTVPGTRFRHSFRTSTRKQGRLMTYLEARNRIIFFARHWGASEFLAGIVKLHAKRMPRYVLTFLEEKRPDMLKAYIFGIMDGLRLVPLARSIGKIPPLDPTRWFDTDGKGSRALDY